MKRGRPSRAEARRRKLGFKASIEEERRLKAVALQNGKTLSEFIREAVADAVVDCSDDPVFRVEDVIMVAH